MRTSATRIGRTVPTEFEGTVRAVWTRACAVSVDTTVPSENDVALVTLVREHVPMTAASIALRLGPGYDFRVSGPAVGDHVRATQGELELCPDSPGEPKRVDLRGAIPYDGLAFPMPGPIDSGLLRPIVDAARRHRTTMSGCDALGRAAADACDALLDRLALSVAEDDRAGAEQAARSLVGLGPGLTPSGDDMLCGFMLGRRVAGGPSRPPDEVVRTVASSAVGSTSDVSAVQLGLASRQRFGEALLEVALALYSGGAPSMGSSVARCLAEGATSGADGLLGLAAGMRTRDAFASAHGGIQWCE